MARNHAIGKTIQGFHERRNQENLWIVISIRFLAYASDSEFRQKGAIENVNGLIRQYIPKNTCFSNISQQQITKIMQKINTRPREKLNFSTPNECFYKNML